MLNSNKRWRWRKPDTSLNTSKKTINKINIFDLRKENLK